MVEEAQGSKVPIQEFADRVVSYFVPIVLGMAFFALALWFVAPELAKGVSIWAQPFLPWVNSDLGVATLAISAFVSTLVIAGLLRGVSTRRFRLPCRFQPLER